MEVSYKIRMYRDLGKLSRTYRQTGSQMLDIKPRLKSYLQGLVDAGIISNPRFRPSGEKVLINSREMLTFDLLDESRKAAIERAILNGDYLDAPDIEDFR